MILDRVKISKFRGFKNAELPLGNNITIISGKNGTQKSTLLGIISQCFTERDSYFSEDKTLLAGKYSEKFRNKFNISTKFDKPKEHEWTLFFKEEHNIDPYTIESIRRSSDDDIRFWKKGSRSKGSGYQKFPVIYLSLKRLLPLGEVENLQDSVLELDEHYLEMYKNSYNNILSNHNSVSFDVKGLVGDNKRSAGIETDKYDSVLNSVGQDNISQLILSLLSFEKLRVAHEKEYQGGLLIIDEIDAGIHPAAQKKLLDEIYIYSKRNKIQVICTSHSTNLIEYGVKKYKQANELKLLYLHSDGEQINIEYFKENSITLNEMFFDIAGNEINKKLLLKKPKIITEDKEAEKFLKCFIKQNKKLKIKNYEFIYFPGLGCDQLIKLSTLKVPPFSSTLIILDADCNSKIKNKKNFFCFPGKYCPEQELFAHAVKLEKNNKIWKFPYTFESAMGNYILDDVMVKSQKAKEWYFNLDKKQKNALIDSYCLANSEEINKIIEKIIKYYS